MDFALSAELQALRERVRDFVARAVVPCENDPRQGAHGPHESLRAELIEHARQAGLLSAHMPAEFGGLGLDHRAKSVFFEEAGYSPLGPVALNIAAPDEGNMHLLERVASAGQKERWLCPLADGRIRSCFCMTEPAPGAGSDPSMLQTSVRRSGDGYVIDGKKWFITGAAGAAFAIVMARDDEGRASMFLTPMDAPGIRIERLMGSLDTCFPGGHAVVAFDNLHVAADAVLGAPGEGFAYAQVRLSPARLTHCMRWLGAVRRMHDLALDYARRREAFGTTLGRHEGVGFMLADNEMDLHAARLVIQHACWVLDQGELGLTESSRAKVLVSEACWRIADRCVQILGGQGVTHETVAARIFADLRAFRIYDGPSEVHRWSLAKRLLKGETRQ